MLDMNEPRLKQLLNDDEIYNVINETHKEIRRENNKELLFYFKILVHACIKRNFYDDSSYYTNPRDYFINYRLEGFLEHVKRSFARFKNGQNRRLFGYQYKDLKSKIL